MKVIMFNGRKRSGKSYTSKKLKLMLESQGYTVIIYSFAYYLKELVGKIFNITVPDVNKYKDYNAKITFAAGGFEEEFVVDALVRRALQVIGTDLVRNIYEDCWVQRVYYEIKNQMNTIDDKVYIIDDWRFVNECTFLQKQLSLIRGKDLFCIRVDGDADKNKALNNVHSSEFALDLFEFDYHFYNNQGDTEGFIRILHELYKLVTGEDFVTKLDG